MAQQNSSHIPIRHLRGFRHRTLWWLVAFFCVGLAIIVQLNSPYSFSNRLTLIDEWMRDGYAKIDTQTFTRSEPETRVVLIDIDEASIAAHGNWPWRRTQIADLIEKLLGQYEVKAVALDMFFSQSADEEGDQRLQALAQHAPLVMAQVFDFKSNRHLPWQLGTLADGHGLPDNLKKYPHMAEATGYLANHEKFKSASYVGNIGFVPDADGVLRKIPRMVGYQNQWYYPLSVRLLTAGEKKPAPPLVSLNSPSVYGQLSDANEEGFARVPFHRNFNDYTVISASHIFAQTAPVEWLKNKLVIIGSSSLSLSDRVATPLESATNGLMVHAQVVSHLLDVQEGNANKAYIPWSGKAWAVGYSFIVIALVLLMFRKYSAFINTSMLIVASVLWLFIAHYVVRHDMWFSPSGPLWVNFTLLLFAMPLAWQTTQKRSRHLLHTLNQYVAKSVVHELLKSDIENPLQPRELQITTLIADMQGYTSQVEYLSMEDSAKLTHDFLACLTGPALAFGGTLDKYTGDGLVAFWGAPLPMKNHADQAVNAALEMIKNVDALSKQRQAEGYAPLRIRIGIETGVAIAGDFGDEKRSIFTAVGDSVNTAARLEDACRHYPYSIVVGQGTKNACTQHEFIELGERALRGKEKAVQLFTVKIKHTTHMMDVNEPSLNLTSEVKE